ncbi:MAG: hypothetical protein IPM16_21070 [Chloroflexi bacterium]|nr:hypothetical protein [Chloroflexota bacterium]
MKHYAQRVRRKSEKTPRPVAHAHAQQQTSDLDELMRLLATGPRSDKTTAAATSLQRAIGNRATANLISRGTAPKQPVIMRNLWDDLKSKVRKPKAAPATPASSPSAPSSSSPSPAPSASPAPAGGAGGSGGAAPVVSPVVPAAGGGGGGGGGSVPAGPAAPKTKSPRVRNQTGLETMHTGIGSTVIANTNPAAGDDEKVDPLDVASEAIEDVTSAADFLSGVKGDLTIEPKSAKYDSIYKDFLRDKGLPANTKEDNLTDKQKEQLAEKQKDEGGVRVLIKDDNARADLGIAATAFSGAAAAGGSLSGIVGFISSIQNWGEAENHWQRADLVMDMIGQGSQTLTGAGQTVAAAGGVVAGGVARHHDNLSAASDVADGFSGASDFIGALGGSVETLVSAAKIVPAAVQLFKGTGEGSTADQVLDITGHSIKVLKGFLSVAKSTISGLRVFLDIAGKSADFVAAVPIVGSAISIGIQLLDILLQAVEIIRHAIRIHKARRNAAKMERQLTPLGTAALKAKKRNRAAAVANITDDKDHLLLKLIEVNRKRVNRAVLPLTSACINTIADVISISGSILNIVGVATSAAYGAGVALMATGYAATGTAGALKLGTALAKPTAALIRFQKQQMRNLAAKDTTNSGKKTKWIVEKAGKVYNKDKSSTKKKAEYLANARRLMTIAKGLDVVKDTDKEPVKTQKLKSYEQLELMIKATGVSPKKLYKQNGNPAEQMKMLIAAMKERG